MERNTVAMANEGTAATTNSRVCGPPALLLPSLIRGGVQTFSEIIIITTGCVCVFWGQGYVSMEVRDNWGVGTLLPPFRGFLGLNTLCQAFTASAFIL